MRPSKLLITLFSILFLLGIAGAAWAPLKVSFPLIAGGLLVVTLIDFALTLRRPKLHFTRDYQKRYALSNTTEVSATITNRTKRRLKIRLYDGLPDHCTHHGYPYLATLRPHEFETFHPTLTFTRRGIFTIQPAHIETSSPLSLWWGSQRIGEEQPAQVFPDYAPALKYGLLATSDRVQQMGIIKKRNRGLSKEFHQLRDYHEGDSLNSIDWKATSRVNRIISREFQEERDQNIMLVADCSLRTRAIDQNLPLLDHLLNAMILISYIATNQGDKVSVMNFGTKPENQRYLAPVKGPQGMSQILNHLYDYQSSDSYGEYEALAKRILAQQRKRTLIIILTNLRSEDQYGCIEAVKLLRQKHIVLLASVQESSVSEILLDPIQSTREANRYLGAAAYEQDAQKIVKELQQQGASVMRSSLDTFSVNLANHYLDLRSDIAT